MKIAGQRGQCDTSLLEEGDGPEKDVSGDVVALGWVVGEDPLVKVGDVRVHGDEPVGVWISLEPSSEMPMAGVCSI